MKKSSRTTARVILGSFLFLGSATLVLLAFNTNLLSTTFARPAEMFSRPMLMGPEAYRAFVQKFGVPKRTRKATIKAPTLTSSVPPAPADAGPKLGFENFEGPGVLTNVTSTSQGGSVNTVEYIAHDAGEPSIGVNWNTNVTAFQSDLQTLFVTFNDSCNLSSRKDTWVNRPAPTSQEVDQDPIGFVDRVTGRTFSAQLTLTSPTCKTSYTDDDGLTWVATAGFGIGSGIDHQTIGGGPYHAPVPQPPTPYQHAFYYCSQLPAAACARSDDGGLTYGPVIEIDPVADAHCIGIHGHVKVSADGTVYVPSNNCDGFGSVIVSTDNGLTWAIRHVPGTTSGSNIIDAQVATDNNNKLYFIMSNQETGGTSPVVATSTTQGQTWDHVYSLGSEYGIQNTAYPYAAAADTNRAAVAFLASTTGGNLSSTGFLGVWHLYVSATFDGGATWSTTDATPNDPMQRGCIWAQGGADICRNLLDFIGASVDKQGRFEVAYVDGCPDGACSQAVSSTTRNIGNSYAARGVIARQSSGRRLVAQYDPASTTSVPGMPLITLRRANGVVHLAWSEADSGNLMINNYQILRGTASGAETLLTNVAGTQTGGSYDDLTATDPTKTYFYKVVAVSSAGSSCANNEIAAPYLGDTCTGFIVQKTPPNHPEQTTQGQTPPSLAIDYVAVAEPPSTSNLVFQMKVTNLATVPPNSRWRIVWNSYSAIGEQFYVGMRTDANSVETFEYGHIATAVVGLVLGVPTETKDGNAVGTAAADGTITITIPKSAVGNPQPGDLLGAVNGRTFTGDTPETNTLERSNALMDHTFAKGQRDNGHPAATYLITGNASCVSTVIVPVSAVSRKTHGSAGNFDVDLPFTGTPGIEDRSGGSSGNHTVVVTFAAPVTVTNASVTAGPGGTASLAGSPVVTGSVVTVNLTNVSNAQTLTINLLGVSDGTHNGNVAVPMSVLLGDTTANGAVNSSDVAQTQAQSGIAVGPGNFREDVTVNGAVNSSDVGLVQAQSGTALP